MRFALCLLVISAAPAAQASVLEAAPDGPWEPASHVIEKSCDLAVELHGALAEVEQTERIANAGTARLGAALDIPLPEGAHLLAASARIAGGKPLDALALPENAAIEDIKDAGVLGADPVVVTADRRSAHVVIQPMEPHNEIAVTLRWTAVAEVRGGALRLVLPGREDTRLAMCQGTVRASAGPGATIARVRTGDDGKLAVGSRDEKIVAELAFSGKEPIVWRQTEDLGEGWTAQALTVIAPPVKATSALPRRALLVIDTSKSMQLVGAPVVNRLLQAIETALPAGAEVEAIAYDRTAARVLGAWRPADPTTFAAIEKVLAHRTPVNGSDAAAAMTLAHQVIADGTRGQTLVIAITDGVFGTIESDALSEPLGGHSADLDLHAIVVDPGTMETPGERPLRAAIGTYGGTFVEVGTAELDEALEGIDGWLRPSWLDLKLAGSSEMPDALRAGTGVTLLSVVPRVGRATLTGESDGKFTAEPKPGPAAHVAVLALARASWNDFAVSDDDDDKAATRYERMLARHPAADHDRAFVVLSDAGKVAKSRRAMVAGGGPFTRMSEVNDPAPQDDADAVTPVRYSQVDRVTLERLFRDQLRPRAYACYQRALGKDQGLGGKVVFTLDIGRGEITRAQVAGLGDAAFDACLLDVAYSLELPLPDPSLAIDDLTVAHYPLEFRLHEDKPFVIAGDADSSAPLDIDKIKPLDVTKRGPVTVETSTPLGNLRP